MPPMETPDLMSIMMSGRVGIKSIPISLMQKNVFGLLTSRELFKVRAVCSDWSDQIKGIWCQVVKDEMLEQVHSLDLLYEKETTSKLLEFKLKYLVSYATLMQNYFAHMNFEDIVGELISLEDDRGRKLLLIASMIVGPQETVSHQHALTKPSPDIPSQTRRDNRRAPALCPAVPDIRAVSRKVSIDL